MSTFTKVAHGLSVNDAIYWGNLVPSDCGLEEGRVYYIKAVPTADTFTISETLGGAEFDLTFDLTDGTLSEVAVYTAITDPTDVMAPPVAPLVPAAPVLASVLLSGVVRLSVLLDAGGEATIRGTEVSITHKFDSNGDPEWDNGVIYMLPTGSTDLTIPALGQTLYAVRCRYQDVFANYSSYSSTTSITTTAGSDALAAAIADLANDVQDGIITETKIADDAISTPKLQAGAVTAEILAATIVLASLLKTADSGRRVEFDSEGIRLYDTDESLLVRIPTNGDPVYVKGEVNANSLVSESNTELRGVASLAGSAVMTLQNGVSAPTAAPTVTAVLDSLALTSTPPNLGSGIGYDSGAGTFWLAADPSVSDYVAHEYNATTGALVRSIPANGTTTTTTTTYGSTSHISDTARATTDNAQSQIAVPIVMPRDGRITKVSIYLRGFSGDALVRNCVWSNAGTRLAHSASYTASSASLGTGNSLQYNKSVGELTVSGGTTYKVGAMLTSDTYGWQWDQDDGSGKTMYLGSGEDFDDFTVTETDTNSKPNVYITYEYDTTTRQETAKMIGVATDGTHVYTLDTNGKVWKYLRADGTLVVSADLSASITGTKANAGLFYDATDNRLVITTTTGTGAGVYPRFLKVDISGTPFVDATISASAGTSFSGSTVKFRGGARVNDALNGGAATYWLATDAKVYAYTWVGLAATQTSARDFGSNASCQDGITYDGSIFRGFSSATPTKIWKFTGWDWTTASDIYWFCYSWYDSAGTTHETAVGPRANLTMRRRERVQVQNPAIPVGGADDPDKVRVYIKPNATDPGAGNFKLQATDALTSRYLTTYDSGGAADGGGTAFAAGTPAELQSSATGWVLKGSGFIEYAGTAFPSGPSTNDHFFRADLGMDFFYDGTRWLCSCLHQLPVPNEVTNISANDSDIARTSFPALAGAANIWWEDMFVGFNVVGGTALSASHKWTINVSGNPTDGGSSNAIVTHVIDSGASSAWRQATVTLNVLGNDTDIMTFVVFALTKTGTPGNLFYYPTLTYRIVAT